MADFSSYNSRRAFPSVLTGPDSTIYPNEDHFFFNIPFFVWINSSYDGATQLYSANVNLSKTTFWGLMVTTKALNGIWWDVTVIFAVSIYFSLCNLWLLFRPVKVVLSKTSKAKLQELRQLSSKSVTSSITHSSSWE